MDQIFRQEILDISEEYRTRILKDLRKYYARVNYAEYGKRMGEMLCLCNLVLVSIFKFLSFFQKIISGQSLDQQAHVRGRSTGQRLQRRLIRIQYAAELLALCRPINRFRIEPRSQQKWFNAIEPARRPSGCAFLCGLILWHTFCNNLNWKSKIDLPQWAAVPSCPASWCGCRWLSSGLLPAASPLSARRSNAEPPEPRMSTVLPAYRIRSKHQVNPKIHYPVYHNLSYL